MGVAVNLVCVIYVYVEYVQLRMFAGWPEGFDLPVGVAMILIVTYLIWKEWEYIFPLLVGLSVLYALFGHHTPVGQLSPPIMGVFVF